jgi:hypothetical protein
MTTTLSERRLADLLKAVVKQCNALPVERPAPDSPNLPVLLADVGNLCEQLKSVGMLCAQAGLIAESERLRKRRDGLNEFARSAVLPALAKGESAEGIAKLKEKYGDFDAEANREHDNTRWLLFLGTVAELRDMAQSLLRSVGRKQKASDKLRPADVAKQLQVSPAKVIGWIRSGQLKAANIATGPRPRYVIQRDDLDRFLSSRQPDLPQQKRHRIKTRSKRY